MNRRDPSAIAALFTPDGVWEVAPPFEHRYQGPEAIADGIAGTIGATVVLVQATGPIVIDLQSNGRATARTSMQEFGCFQDGSSMHAAGTYHDQLAKQADGSWRFVHRRFVVRYYDDLPVPGRVLPDQP